MNKPQPVNMRHLPNEVQTAWHTLIEYLAEAESGIQQSALRAEGEDYYRAMSRASGFTHDAIDAAFTMSNVLDKSLMIP